MSKNIVIYSDGTGQVGGIKPEQRLSNIYKMYQASKVGPDNLIDPNEQVAFYDPGLGSDEHDSFFLSPLKYIKKILSCVLGTGISDNMIDCYEAILKYYEPGDRVYLFGFSRGAYTVRCVANVMNICGIPQHDVDGKPIPRYGKKLRAIAEEAVLRVYEHGAGHERDKYEPQREELARRFRKTYGSEGYGRDGESQGNIQPYFIGVFDTVAALGQTNWRKFLFYLCPLVTFIIGLIYIISTGGYSVQSAGMLSLYPLIVFYVAKKRFRYIKDFPNKGDFNWHIKSWGLKDYDHFLDNLVPYARHAISIDENRAAFERVGWGRSKDYQVTATQHPAWMKQVWFAGGHSDVGGSYPENESRLSDIALHWMLEQIKEPGIEYPVIFNEKLLNLFPDSSGISHCELEILKDKLWPQWWPEKYRFSWSKGKRYPGYALHESVFERLEHGCIECCGSRVQYRPEALMKHEKTKHYYYEEASQT